MDDSLSLLPRVELKHTLRLERQKLYGKRYLPECAYCGTGITGAPDMHEVLFTKGDIRGAEHLSHLINHRCNCVLVHPGGSSSPCHAGIQTKQGQLRAIRHLLFWEGDAIDVYVKQVEEHFKGAQARWVQLLVKEVDDEMPDMRA